MADPVDPKDAGKISHLPPLNIVTGDELIEVVALDQFGELKNYRLLVNKIRTNQGLSAYEVAVKNGFQGTESEWLTSLHGQSAYALAKQLGFTGTEQEWLDSLVGPGAYETAVEEGFTGTKQEWLDSMKGQSAYQLAVLLGFVGTEAEWLESLVGKSAFQTWLELPGNAGKTEAMFVASIKGEKGDKGDTGAEGPEGPKGTDGAVGPQGPKGDKGDAGAKGDTGAEGPVGPAGAKGDKGDTGAAGPKGDKGDTGATGAEGPEGPQGEKGDKGDKGDIGAPGKVVNIKDTVTEEDFEENIFPLTTHTIGDGWFVTNNESTVLWIWTYALNGVGGRWENSDNLRGPSGTGLIIKGKWPDALPLPVSGAVKGDTYGWKNALYTFMLKPNQTEEIPANMDYFQIVPEGPKGDTGPQGPIGLTGEQGPRGIPGEARAPYTIVDNLTTPDDLPSIGSSKAEEAYTADMPDGSKHLWVFSPVQAKWIDTGPISGPRGLTGPKGDKGDAGAAGAQGPKGDKGDTGAEGPAGATGPEGQRGEQGPEGPKGADGRNVEIENSYATLALLEAATVEVGKAYSVTATNTLYYVKALPATVVSGNLIDLGSFKGDKGDKGDAGAAGPQGPKGDTGATGAGLVISGTKANEAAIKAIVAPVEQETWEAADTGNIWIFAKGAWVDLGPFRGPKGDKGDTGETGPQGPKGDTGVAGPKGDTGATGPKGDKGDAGPIGPEGPQGEQGDPGAGLETIGSYPTISNAPAASAANKGKAVNTDDQGLYVNISGTEWVNIGPAGAPGPRGPKGDRGSEWLIWLDGMTNPNDSPNFGQAGDWVMDPTGWAWKKETTTWIKVYQYFAAGVQEVATEDLQKKMVRYNGGWIVLPVDAPPAIAANVGKKYVWNITAVDTAGWAEYTAFTFPEPPADSKRYNRQRLTGQADGGWVEAAAAGIGDVTGATVAKQYVRQATSATAGTWVEFAGLTGPTTAGKKYIRTSVAWEEFNTYTLPVQYVPVAGGTTAIDLRTNQVIEVAHTTNTNKVINLTNPPDAGRAQTVVAVVRGNGAGTGTCVFQINGVTIEWNADTAPVFGAGKNVVTILVVTPATGSAYAVGSAGAQTGTP